MFWALLLSTCKSVVSEAASATCPNSLKIAQVKIALTMGPNNRVLGPKYYDINGIRAPKPIIWVLGPFRFSLGFIFQGQPEKSCICPLKKKEMMAMLRDPAFPYPSS